MISAGIQHFLDLANESHEVEEKLIDMGHARFSAVQSYYTIFYLAQAMLQSQGLTFSSHSAVVAAYGKEFAKTGVLDPKFTAISLTRKNAARLDIMAVYTKM